MRSGSAADTAALQYPAPLNYDRRTVSNECGAGWLIQYLSELLAVQSCDVCVQFEVACVPNFPSGMLDSIFAAAAAKRSVAPVMFSDKFGVRSRWNCLRLSSCPHFKRFPFAAAAP